jgi:hypothetical protein
MNYRQLINYRKYRWFLKNFLDDFKEILISQLLLRCSEASRPEERRRTVGRETNAAAEAAADQDGQGEGGVEEEDEGEIRSQV